MSSRVIACRSTLCALNRLQEVQTAAREGAAAGAADWDTIKAAVKALREREGEEMVLPMDHVRHWLGVGAGQAGYAQSTATCRPS